MTLPSPAPVLRRLRLPAVLDRVALSRSTLYSRIHAGLFPKPLRDGHTSSWLEHEVNAWVLGSWQASKAEALLVTPDRLPSTKP